MKVKINNEEVLCDKNIIINEEMLNTSSVILNNVYPKTWEQDKDYVSRFYYPKDYSKCKIYDEIEHPEEREDAEGTNFSIEVDTTKQYQVQTLKGQTSQTGTPTPSSPIPINITTGRQVVSVCGKNLFDKSIATTQVGYFNSSGNIESGGQSTVTTSYIPILPNTNLTISGFVVNRICYYDKNKTFLERSEVISTTPYTFNKNAYYIRIQGVTDVFNLNNFQLEKGNQATTYEEYKGNDYEINLGKNLISISNVTRTLNGLTGTINGNTITISGTNTKTDANYSLVGTYTFLDFPNMLPGETYTISLDGNTSGAYFQINYYKNGTTTQGGLVNQVTGTTTFTVPSDYTGVAQAFVGIYRTATTMDTTFNVQLEKGSSASSYTPYKTPIYLGKIGNYKDNIFRNTTENPLYDSNLEEGQWYIHKEIGRYDFTGTENFSASQWGTNSWDLLNIIATTFNTNELQIMSNLFKGVPHANRGTGGNNIIYTTSNNGFEIRNTTYSTLTDIRNATKGSYIYWVLATPTNTLIEDEELINQLNSIELLEGLNNVSVSSANLPFIMSLMYNYQEAYTEETLYFSGVVENTGNISLNPRYPHYCNLQVLDFKTFLSEGETLDFVIFEKTILEAINQVIGTISDYGFILGNVNILHGDDVIGAYSTKNKTAYDVFNYIADITQSRWTTRMIDENTVAIDFYDPTLMPQGTSIEYTQNWFRNNKIQDMSFSYSSRDYRNKQVMLSGEVYANIETTEIIVADGYQTQFNTTDKIGYVSSMLLNNVPVQIITKEEYDLGYEGDFIYQPGDSYFESVNLVSTGAIITIVYYAIIEGREVILNQEEISRITNMIDRKGVIARYENRNDATTTSELQAIGQSYLKYKGSPEIILKVESLENIWNIGERVQFTAPLEELTTEYMIKKKTTQYIPTQDKVFYTYELSSNFNSETEINYFDNQRYKSHGNIGEGEYISRNIDIENTANVIFEGFMCVEANVNGNSTLQATLEIPLGVE